MISCLRGAKSCLRLCVCVVAYAAVTNTIDFELGDFEILSLSACALMLLSYYTRLYVADHNPSWSEVVPLTRHQKLHGDV
ncbi:hypothetical protein F4679DRAFT_361036 [Xylaria curta]|nr:hypothetical protein F4679DRAFT_361036 [Xylaria curta]